MGDKPKKKKAQRSNTASLLPPEDVNDTDAPEMPVGIKLIPFNNDSEIQEVNAEDAEKSNTGNLTTTVEAKGETKTNVEKNEQNTSEKKNDEKANALRELALKEKQEIMRVKEEATKSALLQNRENQEFRVTSDQDKECSKTDEECLAVEEK